MSKTTAQLRELWGEFECMEDAMVLVPFGPDKIRVAPPTAEAWQALAAVLLQHGYNIRTKDTDSYNCRDITGGTGRSLHSFGIALDVNWTTNPFNDHPGERQVRFSDKPTQDERANDVRFGKADTDMTPEMIADVEAIRTTEGIQVFEWGGSWSSRKDCMHFELDVSPEELAKGIDRATVKGLTDAGPTLPVARASVLAAPMGMQPHVVIARDGLRLRSGPSDAAAVVRAFPLGTRVNVLSREGQWALVDVQGDGLADGFMFLGFLKPVSDESGAQQPALPGAQVSGPSTAGMQPHVVIARDGLRVRSGPSDTAAIVRALPLGTRVNVLSREGQWAQVDLEGDGLADGFMFLAFLKPVPDEPGGTGRGGADIAVPIAVNRRSVLASLPTEPWIAAVTDIAARSKIAQFEWENRGVAPMGYIKGMALVYARVYGKLNAGDAAATEMARAKTADPAHDALAWYSAEFAELGMNNDIAGADTLRHLFVLLIGLGMRESSGRCCEGRDRSASNTTAETAEAGLFQTSFNAMTASPLLPILFANYSDNPSGFLEVFKEGVTPPCTPADLENNFGSGDGREFQRLSKACPAFAAEFAAVGLRHARTHWGPINTRAAELRPECDEMLRQAQAAVDRPPEV
jgi:uncharacterized protein YgiM (DUF1202 family)